ncbi:hypothetical protein AAZX31_13G011500 [Glycine max]
MAVQLIHDRVEMECLEGAWETLEGNARCRFRGTIRFTATSLAHPDEPVRTLQRTMEWILPTLTSYRLVEPVQVIEVTSSEEDPEEDPEELPPEPAVDTLDFLEGDEDPLHFLRWILPRKSCRHLRQTLRRIVARERWRPVEALHHSGQFHGLVLYTFLGWVYLGLTIRFTLFVFVWVDLLYRNLMIVYMWLKPPLWTPLLWMTLCIL